MKQDFKNYLNEIGISAELFTNIEKKHRIIRIVCDVDEFDGIFLSEASSNDGTRVYFHLFGFKDDLLCRISISTFDPIVFRINNHLTSAKFDEANYDFSEVTAKSKLHMAIRRTDAEGWIGFSSSGINCAYLMNIYKIFLLPNIAMK